MQSLPVQGKCPLYQSYHQQPNPLDPSLQFISTTVRSKEELITGTNAPCENRKRKTKLSKSSFIPPDNHTQRFHINIEKHRRWNRTLQFPSNSNPLVLDSRSCHRDRNSTMIVSDLQLSSAPEGLSDQQYEKLLRDPGVLAERHFSLLQSSVDYPSEQSKLSSFLALA